MLLERPGQVVTREELQQKLWPIDTFVDFEHNLNAAVKRLRRALDDSAETPRFVETLSRQDRFVVSLTMARWITFEAADERDRSIIFVVPFRSESALPESEWSAVTNGPWDDKPRWSPNGNLIYFVSDRDRFLCLWAQRLDPATKRPRESPFNIYHFHSARRSLANQGPGLLEISVARDKIVFSLDELTGNIWIRRWRAEGEHLVDIGQSLRLTFDSSRLGKNSDEMGFVAGLEHPTHTHGVSQRIGINSSTSRNSGSLVSTVAS